MSKELRPCPFCGSEDTAFIEFKYNNNQCYCSNCEATLSVSSNNKEDAIDAWNTRTNVGSMFRAIGEAGALQEIESRKAAMMPEVMQASNAYHLERGQKIIADKDKNR